MGVKVSVPSVPSDASTCRVRVPFVLLAQAAEINLAAVDGDADGLGSGPAAYAVYVAVIRNS